MRARSWDRMAAGAGIGTVVLFVIGSVVVGDRPRVDDPTAELAAYYGDDRANLVAALILYGLGAVLFLWFAASLASTLYAYGQGRLAATALGAGILVVGGLLLVLVTNGAAILLASDDGDEGALEALHHLEWASEVVVAWPIAALIAATAAAAERTVLLPRWYAGLSGVAAVVLLLSGTIWAEDGFWAPDGAYGIVAFLLFLVWTVVTSVLLIRRTPVAEAARAEAGA